MPGISLVWLWVQSLVLHIIKWTRSCWFSFFLCVWVFCLYVCAHTVGAWCLRRPEEGSGSLELELRAVVCLFWIWELKSSVRAISALITTEPSLQLFLYRVYQLPKKQNKKRNTQWFKLFLEIRKHIIFACFSPPLSDQCICMFCTCRLSWLTISNALEPALVAQACDVNSLEAQAEGS